MPLVSKKGKRTKKKKRSFFSSLMLFLLKKIYALLVFLSVCVIVVAIYLHVTVKPPEVSPPPTFTDSSQGASSSAVDAFSSSDIPTPEPKPELIRRDLVYNILLLGVDDGHGNADTIMICNFDVTNKAVSLISVPRDTLVERDWSSFPKINAAYGSGGVGLLTEELTKTLGVPIDYYVKVDLNAFVHLVDALGGLDYNVPEDMYHDDEAGFIIDLKAGQQHLTGEEALQLVRYRGYLSADIGRTDTQRAVMTELAKKAISLNSLTKIDDFVEIFNENVETDLSFSDMLYLAQEAMGVDLANNLFSGVLPGRGDAVENGYEWCYELDKNATITMINAFLNPYTRDLLPEELNLVSADYYLT